ncbi:DapH/DapD/GlmU-related protein [Pedobacter cryoconitis]|uniref:Lipopolysaccharide O-acetyltransferase n=1 Tax=Pedobacter cryoconitis TaxID=188932 RepID=A0A7X0J7U1_9SPHI|nr:DapH/DapD/GlmU-related protein [Pedobacter cryoconitis]MBB6502410.1 lipopolysaccharide O-acetyltransferase [Pedobacter cryoconitis]
MNIISKYGFFGAIIMAKNLLLTKLTLRNARLIRFPVDLRGKKFISVDKGFTTGHGCRIEAYAEKNINSKTLIIGKNVQLNDYVHITAMYNVHIGDNVLIASKVYISDTAHGEYQSSSPSSPFEFPAERELVYDGVRIEDNVWLGDGVCVLPGVTIGFGSIIGANAVVNKDIPAMSIAVGIPAKVVKVFNSELNIWEKR